MPKYIEADKAIEWAKENLTHHDKEIVEVMLDEVPTADVQEVVRCKDCVHFCPYEVVEDFDGRCTARGGETDNDGFCNYGEKGRCDE